MGNLVAPLLAVGWILFGLATLVVAARFYTRVIYLSSVRSDDYLMFAAWVFALFNICLGTVASGYGLGRHIQDVDRSKIPTFNLVFQLIKFPSILGSYLSRLSFSITLLMIVRNTRHRRTRILVWATIAYESFFTLFIIIQIYAQCGSHAQELIRPSPLYSEHCLDQSFERNLAYVQSGANSLADMVLAAIPFFLIRSFSLPEDVKQWSKALCLLGFIAFAASTFKAVQISRLGLHGDFPFNLSILAMAVYIETSMLLILMSIPSLRPLKEAKKRYAPFELTTLIGAHGDRKGSDVKLGPAGEVGADDQVEKGSCAGEGQGGIRAVTEVEITREDRRDDELISQRILYGF